MRCVTHFGLSVLALKENGAPVHIYYLVWSCLIEWGHFISTSLIPQKDFFFGWTNMRFGIQFIITESFVVLLFSCCITRYHIWHLLVTVRLTLHPLIQLGHGWYLGTNLSIKQQLRWQNSSGTVGSAAVWEKKLFNLSSEFLAFWPSLIEFYYDFQLPHLNVASREYLWYSIVTHEFGKLWIIVRSYTDR